MVMVRASWVARGQDVGAVLPSSSAAFPSSLDGTIVADASHCQKSSCLLSTDVEVGK